MLVPKSLLTPQRTNLPLNPFEAEERLFTLRLFSFFDGFPMPLRALLRD